MEKITRKKVQRTLRFSEMFDRAGKFTGGGVLNTINHIDDEMWVELMDDPVIDRETGEMVPTGRIQLHLGGTRRAFEEMGVFLLAMAHYRPAGPGYSLSFDLTDIEEKPTVHLVVHLPEDNKDNKHTFLKIHTVATAMISKDRKELLETTIRPNRDKE